MRNIKQPGATVTERIQWVEARGHAFRFTLEAGLPLLEATRRGFAAEGFASGVLNFGSGALGPFAYVMPALSKTFEHAAFYSDTFRPAGVTRLKMGAMTLGKCSSLALECGDVPPAVLQMIPSKMAPFLRVRTRLTEQGKHLQRVTCSTGSLR